MRLQPLISAAGFVLAAAAVTSRPVLAQDREQVVGRCATPDSVVIVGASRNTEQSIRDNAGLLPGAPLNARIVQLSIKSLYATGQYEDVAILCEAPPGAPTRLIIRLKERPLLEAVSVVGVSRLNEGSVRDKANLALAKPLDPADVAKAVARIDSMYNKAGFYLARVKPETTVTASGVTLTFRVDEGRRLAVSGVKIDGNKALSEKEIVAALKTKPEGFWWFRGGEFNDDHYAGDLSERLPALYASKGMIDFEVLRDTMIVDREHGKALLQITVKEGPQYEIGSFEAEGNTRFSSEDITRFYPFGEQSVSLRDRVGGIVRRVRGAPKNVFDRSRWDEATERLKTAYSNEGYIYAQVRPILDRKRVGADSVPVVDLRWQIDERQPAIVNRVEILGNDYTQEQCIRDQLVLIPGDVFNQDRLIRSYQNIANLGFFNTPLPPPDTRTANDQGDVDLIFKVTEKRTGNINFGASVGAQVGVGGFIGLDQPNLFGMCKRGSLQWQFGSTVNDFNLSYTDPNIKRSLVSGTATAYHSVNRFLIANVGRSIRTGGSLQIGLPLPRSRYTRAFISYGGEKVQFGEGGFLRNQFSSCSNCFRSTLGFSTQHDTRIDLPFATAGGLQSASLNFNGGPLGGTAKFAQFRTELKGYAPLAQFGGNRPGSSPVKIAAGLAARAGAVFGDPGPFIYSQGFALGGVQYGEQLRGYPEFSITPDGFLSSSSSSTASINSFGRSFFTTTAEVGVRFNQMIYLSSFVDAGNVWRRASDFDPSRLFRGAGFGASVVTPLGPLGLDYAYGFDRRDVLGRREPRWQFHFRLGQLF